MANDKPLDLLTEEEITREKLGEVSKLDLEIQKREVAFLPTTYGLPDLLRPQEEDEDDEQFKTRQNAELSKLIEDRMRIHKDGKAFPIRLFPRLVDFIGDAFFKREPRLILWKPRGGGGSVGAAIVVFVAMIYRNTSFMNMSGSAKQAKAIYNHVCGFWDDFPELKRTLLKSGHPLKAEMEMLNGVRLEAVPASEKQARHQHVGGMVLDEAAQPEGHEIGYVMQTALEGTMSEPDHMIMLVSTFHEPAGFFADIWDFAKDRGFAQYKFDIFDSMTKCDDGLDTATETDPKALKYCLEQCPLTELIQHADSAGNVVGEEHIGCCGKARNSSGFQTQAQIIRAKKINIGTDKFAVEFCCIRPKYKRQIYNPDLLDELLVDDWTWEQGGECVVGIDWGFAIQACVLLVVRGRSPSEPDKEGLCVVEAEFLSQELVGTTIMKLKRWMEDYGLLFEVYADMENPYNNAELDAIGFDVSPVNFGIWKEAGIANISRWMGRKRLYFIGEHRELITQMKQYRRTTAGVPKNPGKDHGPDALLAAMIKFPAMEEFESEIGDGWSPARGRMAELQGPGVHLI